MMMFGYLVPQLILDLTLRRRRGDDKRRSVRVQPPVNNTADEVCLAAVVAGAHCHAAIARHGFSNLLLLLPRISLQYLA